jgi:hypothetical protein
LGLLGSKTTLLVVHAELDPELAVGTADESLSGPVLAFIRKYTK